MDKKNRKKILRSLKKRQLQKKKEELPFKLEVLGSLLDYLDVNLVSCDDDFKLTSGYLKSHGIKMNDVSNWFEENGAYCDCKVLANIAGLAEDLFKYKDS